MPKKVSTSLHADMEEELPVDLIFNIFSRIPLKSLVCFKSVSKKWRNTIDNPYLAMMHLKQQESGPQDKIPLVFRHNPNREPPSTLSFHVVRRSKETTAGAFEVEKDPVSEFPTAVFCSSCYGLLCFRQGFNTFVVIHPLRGEVYELPSLMDLELGTIDACGLGFDDQTNTFKAVCVSTQRHLEGESIKKNVRVMVHVLGTSSWREISRCPFYLITRKNVFARGSLYWLVESGSKDYIICCFDLKKEEFGSIDHPNSKKPYFESELVDLNGELGIAYRFINRYVEIWVMKEYGLKKDWVMYCRIDEKPSFPYGVVDVIGTWNKEGDVLLISEEPRGSGKWERRFLLYGLRTGLRLLDITGLEESDPEIHIYSGSLLSIRGIMENAINN